MRATVLVANDAMPVRVIGLFANLLDQYWKAYAHDKENHNVKRDFPSEPPFAVVFRFGGCELHADSNLRPSNEREVRGTRDMKTTI